MVKQIKNLQKTLEKFKPNVRPVTIKSYISYIENLHYDLEGNREVKNIDFLKDDDTVLEELDHNFNYLSKRNILNAVIVLLRAVNANKHLISIYGNRRDQYNDKYLDQLEDPDYINESQEKNMITKEELDDIVGETRGIIAAKKLCKKPKLTKKEYSELQLYVILSFYIAYPLRNDIVTLKYMKKSEYSKLDGTKPNVFLWDKSMIILNEYKTSKSLGQNKILIDKKNASLLRCLIKQQQNTDIDNPEDYLIVKQNGKPYTKVDFSNLLIQFFKKKTGKSISTTLLRKIYLSKYSNVKDEMAKDAKMMGHSTATQQKIYVK
tara:strand:+ start:334 stop:1296 length:963 start_codon:yes stop_codon:yes gene_type:complete